MKLLLLLIIELMHEQWACRSDVVADGKRSSKRSSKRPSRKQRYSSTPSGSSYTGSETDSETDRSRSPARRKKAAAAPPAAPAAKGAPQILYRAELIVVGSLERSPSFLCVLVCR